MISSSLRLHPHRSSLPRICAAAAAAPPQEAAGNGVGCDVLPRLSVLPRLCSQPCSRLFAASPRRWNGLPGQGGASEERMIAQSISKIREREYPVVVEVMNASHVDWASRQLPSMPILRRNARLWIRALTHADLLNEEALRYQMERASFMPLLTDSERDPSNVVTTVSLDDQIFAAVDGEADPSNEESDGGRRIPVVALNLSDVGKNNSKAKSLRSIKELLLGAKLVAAAKGETPKILVCGLPNAGKSSLIYPLTKSRTLSVKKKSGYHLPKINKTAGWTLGMKSHAFDIKTHGMTETVTLTDTPGMRPRLEDISRDDELMAQWLATCCLKPQRGMLTNDDDVKELREHVLYVLWRGLRRHAELSSEDFRLDSPQDLWALHTLRNGDDATMYQLIQSCHEGDYGGVIIEDTTTDDVAKVQSMVLSEGDQKQLAINNPGSAVMAINDSAAMLISIGTTEQAPNNDKISQMLMPRSRKESQQQKHNHRHIPLQNSDAAAAPNRIGKAERAPDDERNSQTSFPKSKDKSENKGSSVNNEIWQRPSPKLRSKNEQKRKDRNHIRQRNTDSNKKLPGSTPERHWSEARGSVTSKSTIVRLPEHQRRLECMKCAGFIEHDKLGNLRGTRYTRVINWNEDEIRSFYSRMVEAFGGEGSPHTRYLMMDSLVLTLKNKHQLSSKRKVYEKYKGKGLGGYPVRNEDRSRRFRQDQPVPMVGPIVCTNTSRKACKFTHDGLDRVGPP